MAETWLLPLLLVSWVINRGPICGKLLEVPYQASVGFLLSQSFGEKEQICLSFFLPFFFFFLSFFLCFFFLSAWSFLVAGLSIARPRCMGEEKKETSNSSCCFSALVPSSWYTFFFPAFRFIFVVYKILSRVYNYTQKKQGKVSLYFLIVLKSQLIFLAVVITYSFICLAISIDLEKHQFLGKKKKKTKKQKNVIK